jgi:hypothetical protein
LKAHLHHSSKVKSHKKKSQNREKKDFSDDFCWLMKESTSSEIGNEEEFLLKQSCGSLEHNPGRHKKIEDSEQFQKRIQKPQREYGGERLGRPREGNQPSAGPHPDPDTS